MNVEYVGRNFTLNDDVRAFTENKLEKIYRFLHEPAEIRVTLEVEKHRHIADLHLAHRFGVIQAAEETDNMLDAIHLAVEKAEKQVRRSAKKFQDRRRRADRINGGNQWPVDVVEAESLDRGEVPRVIRSTRLTVKPMSLDEAVLVLKTSKNEFVVFRDAESDRVNVLYRRKDNNYGLIAPEF